MIEERRPAGEWSTGEEVHDQVLAESLQALQKKADFGPVLGFVVEPAPARGFEVVEIKLTRLRRGVVKRQTGKTYGPYPTKEDAEKVAEKLRKNPAFL